MSDLKAALLRADRRQNLEKLAAYLEALPDDYTEATHDLIKRIRFPLSKEDFKVGDRWVQRNGKIAEILSTDKGYVEVSTDAFGRFFDGSHNADNDLVFNLDYSKPKASRTANGKFAVGQVWADRGGRQATISSVTHDVTGKYPVLTSLGNGLTEDGRYFNSDQPCSADLVTLITDVE